MLDYDTPVSISQHFYNGIMIRAHIHSENGSIWLVGADTQDLNEILQIARGKAHE